MILKIYSFPDGVHLIASNQCQDNFLPSSDTLDAIYNSRGFTKVRHKTCEAAFG